MTLELEGIAGAEQSGLRLDAALVALFPFFGLRARRRLWKDHQVLVDGLARAPAFRLRGGETIRLAPLCPANAASDPLAEFAHDPPRLLERRGDFFFLYKPGGLHVESLAGAPTRSLAAVLERITPDVNGMRPILLSRLDLETSGIVPAAGDEDAARQWRRWENAGGVGKGYLAVLEGGLADETLARNALDTARKSRTRVLEADGPVLRHTRISPLAGFQAGEAPELMSGHPDGARFTLALCRIAKGARHQIRAHAAHIGHPLAGDALYGSSCGASFFLHHFRIQWSEGQVSCLPPWFASLPDHFAGLPVFG
ncbi:MAG: RNA pseudouridine synthase [Deltaproteobacteria bacterium]|nr:RNA pseudouridine synthase [Deltaproteobacteria bacterium]